MTARLRRVLHDQRGITMIELLVTLVLGTLVLSIVGGLLINSLQTQNTVRSAAEATNTGQLVLRSIDSGVRNASAVRVSESGRLLVARTTGATAETWVCRAWYLDSAGNGTIYMTESATAAGIDTSTASSSWTKLGSAVAVGIATPFTPASMPAPDVTALTVSLKLDAGDAADVSLTRVVAPRLPSATAGNCFS